MCDRLFACKNFKPILGYVLSGCLKTTYNLVIKANEYKIYRKNRKNILTTATVISEYLHRRCKNETKNWVSREYIQSNDNNNKNAHKKQRKQRRRKLNKSRLCTRKRLN